jgi:type III secretion protein Q
VPATTAPRHAARTSEAFHALRLPVSFRLGSTPIQLREISSIRPGDIVGIEQWSSSGSAIVVTAELGGPGGLHLWAVAEGSRITVQQSRDSAMKPDTPADPAPAADNVNLPLDRLDALEVTLRFEVGDLSMSLGELKSIRAGHVFDLAQPLNRSPVRILAHGNVLGKGYLVAVGDRLGVRVSEFAPGEV